MNHVILSDNEMESSMIITRLKSVIRIMNDIISDVDEIMMNFRNLFPRLYFITDYQLIKLLSCEISQNITNINPFVHLCFPSIQNVIFYQDSSFPYSSKAIGFVSVTEEKLDLFKPLHSLNIASQWLKQLELILKSTMKFYIESCVVQQITETGIEKHSTRLFLSERMKSTVFEEINQVEI